MSRDKVRCAVLRWVCVRVCGPETVVGSQRGGVGAEQVGVEHPDWLVEERCLWGCWFGPGGVCRGLQRLAAEDGSTRWCSWLGCFQWCLCRSPWWRVGTPALPSFHRDKSVCWAFLARDVVYPPMNGALLTCSAAAPLMDWGCWAYSLLKFTTISLVFSIFRWGLLSFHFMARHLFHFCRLSHRCLMMRPTTVMSSAKLIKKLEQDETGCFFILRKSKKTLFPPQS